ncbi:PqqD family protein [Kribbella solani]|uniref:PqqD family protein n=1 Tax=Kribbella solani TaxID=236067 RepID=UPI0029BC2D32|nr:PqqD family protein [Kribbella solani]MDX2968344.1 PqqD family protein [Kribbella solani]MDX3000749.1 PqqD family protein [Kribbella solani]
MLVRLEQSVPATITADGGIVLLSRSGRVFRGNGTAATIWQTLAQCNGDMDEATNVISRTYQRPAPQLRADVEQFAVDLVDRGLATVIQ